MIAKAMSHEPNILFLDEPTAGVDVELRHSLWKNLYDLKKNGVTIFLTTHYIEEAEQLCERVAIIDNGKIIAVNTPQKLTQSHGRTGLEISLNTIPQNFGIKDYQFRKMGNKIYVETIHPEKDMIAIINQISDQECEIENVKIYRSSLEDVFMALTGKSINDEKLQDIVNV